MIEYDHEEVVGIILQKLFVVDLSKICDCSSHHTIQVNKQQKSDDFKYQKGLDCT
jgi:hypothetical protein